MQISAQQLMLKADRQIQLPDAAGASGLFACPICLEKCARSEVFVPSGCTHEFCRECARGVVLSAVR